MKRIQELVGRELKWTQPHALRSEFHLVDGEDVVTALRFQGFPSSNAIAETAHGRWTFKRSGFWRPQVAVTREGSGNEIATFRSNPWSAGGTLEVVGGGTYRASTNFWISGFAISDGAGEPLIRFHRFGGPFHLSSMVQILPRAAALPELPWLVALGWYIVVRLQHDSAGAAAAAAG
jgi:hypothetical protein